MIWLATLAGAYVLLVAALAVCQDRLVFPAAGRGDRGLPPIDGLELQTLRRADGAVFRAVFARTAEPPLAVALYFVGNGEDLFRAAEGAAELRRYGLEVLGVEHPGYGASAGPPTVATVLGGAEAAARHAAELARLRGVPLVAIGSSLGTFCAVHIASLGLVDRLLLRAPPTSMVAAAHARFWWLPVGWVLRHHFDNLGRAAGIRCPTLVLHGDVDRIVPLAHAESLCRAIAGPCELIVARGHGHADLPLAADGPFGARIATFLRGR